MSWDVKKLGELCFIEKGNIGITKAIPGDFPLVVLGDERRTHNEYQFDDDAVIIPLVSSTGHGHKSMKRIHFQSGKFAVGSILCAVIPKDKSIVSAQYLYRYLNLYKEQELVARMKGMANVSLPVKSIAEVEIPVPPIEIQNGIIEKIDSVETYSISLTVEQQRQLDLLKKLRQQILQDAVQGKLVPQDPDDEPAGKLLERIKLEKEKLIKEKKIKKEKPLPEIKPEEIPFEIPENWVWCRLNRIGTITGGGTPSMANDEYWNGNIPWVSPKDMLTDFIHDSEMKITVKGVEESSANIIQEKSIIIVGRSGILKRRLPVAINEVKCTVNQDMKVIIPHIDKMSRYLQFMFRGLEPIILREYVKFGMTVHSLKYNEFAQMPIPIPPIQEQHHIVSKIEQLLNLCDELEQTILQNQKYTQDLLKVALKEALEAG